MAKLYSDHSKHLRGKDLVDREERKSSRERGIILQPRYREAIGPTPTLAAGDTQGAQAYLDKIVRTLQAGGWTRDERNRLKRIKRKWIKKAAGEDRWFMEHGNPQSGEDGNAYGREGWKEQRRREEIRAAVREINEKWDARKSETSKADETQGK